MPARLNRFSNALQILFRLNQNVLALADARAALDLDPNLAGGSFPGGIRPGRFRSQEGSDVSHQKSHGYRPL